MRYGLSFQSQPVETDLESEIFGRDDRHLVTNTLQIPFRFVCCLAFEVVNPSNGNRLPRRGSGTLIGERHVLTCAHNVLNDYSDRSFPISYVRSTNMLVAPARNDRDLPGNVSAIRTARVAPQWQVAANKQAANGNTRRVFGPDQADFALLTLDTPLGSRFPLAPVTMQLPPPPLGWWGHPRFGGNTRIRAYDAALLQRMRGQTITVNLSGYPVDKCRNRPAFRAATPAELAACTGHIPGMPEWRDRGSTQWYSTGRLIEPAQSPGLITYDADSAHGHSGGPVWLNWQGYRNLVAVHTGGFRRLTAPADIIANRGVRITEPLLQQLRAWMRLDRVEPGF
jgi:V8-like Glu-specific endopeptidase